MANTEVVLLPEEDGTVGRVAVQTDAGAVLLQRAFEITSSASGGTPVAPSVVNSQQIAERFADLLRFQAETGFGDNGDLRQLFDLGQNRSLDRDTDGDEDTSSSN